MLPPTSMPAAPARGGAPEAQAHSCTSRLCGSKWGSGGRILRMRTHMAIWLLREGKWSRHACSLTLGLPPVLASVWLYGWTRTRAHITAHLADNGSACVLPRPSPEPCLHTSSKQASVGRNTWCKSCVINSKTPWGKDTGTHRVQAGRHYRSERYIPQHQHAASQRRRVAAEAAQVDARAKSSAAN